MYLNKFFLAGRFFITVIIFSSCSPQVELTASWANKQAQISKDPLVMVLAMAKDLGVREIVEDNMVDDFKKAGYRAISSLDLFNPDIRSYDSVALVNLLRENKIDMLLTNAVVNVSEKERYVEGTTEQVPVGTYNTPNNPFYNNNYYYNNYYSNYTHNNYNQDVYQTRSTPGYTVTDVEIVIESRLYSVENSQLLWYGQSKSYTEDPASPVLKAFARIVVSDIKKKELLPKVK